MKASELVDAVERFFLDIIGTMVLPLALEGRRRGLKVYLAGGFRSGWQDIVMAAVPEFVFLDPRVHGLQDEMEYLVWDLEAVHQSDWVFAYLEATNPAGYALALEVGYAKALGKRIIFVDEKSVSEEQLRRYLSMVRAAADVTVASLEEGIAFLKMLARTVG